jgi:hypothetical protein
MKDADLQESYCSQTTLAGKMSEILIE